MLERAMEYSRVKYFRDFWDYFGLFSIQNMGLIYEVDRNPMF